MQQFEGKSLESETPTDVQHPIMYERAVYIQGGIVGLCVVGIAVLLICAPGVAEVGVPVLGTIALSAVNSLAGLLKPKQG